MKIPGVGRVGRRSAAAWKPKRSSARRFPRSGRGRTQWREALPSRGVIILLHIIVILLYIFAKGGLK
jgi:hypothetical protein